METEKEELVKEKHDL